MKRILRVGLMVLLTAVLGVGSAWGESKEWTDGNGMQWEYEEIEPGKTCRIWPKDINSLSGGVDIPGAVEDGGSSITVVEIGEEAFQGCRGLKEVTIPSSVTKIGADAFAFCFSLTEVTIPAGVTEIGTYAFIYCLSLTEVTIPASMTEIGGGAFSSCRGLKSIAVESGNEKYCAAGGVLFTKDKATLICYPGGKPEESYIIPSSVTEIGEDAFSGCISLTAVTIPEGVTEIGSSAFLGCSSLAEVTIPNSVTKIGEYAFFDCSSLTEVTIPNSVTEIERYAFSGCSSLTEVTIPNSVTEIGEYAFSGCIGLKRVTLPDGVKSIGKGVFVRCSGLTEVTIPASVTEIGEYAFDGCIGLKRVTLPDGVKTIKYRAFGDCKELAEVTIPASVTEIGENAFDGCIGLKRVTLPDGVKTIKYRAFGDCKELAEVTIPASVTEIGKRAFYGCIGLKRVTLPDGVKTIEYYAFGNCKELTEVTIPASVTEIGETAFDGCSGLKSIAVDSGNENYCAEDGVLFTKDKKTLICYPSGKEGEYTISGSVTAIGDYAFYGCNGLKRVTISDGVNAIGIYAFAECKELTEVTIPRSVKVVTRGTFYGCIGLKDVRLPETIEVIGEEAFRGCSGLKEVTIPSSVGGIEWRAFSGCSELKAIEVEEGNENFCAVDGVLFTKDMQQLVCYPGGKVGKYIIPRGVKEIKEWAFWDCDKLEVLEVEEGNEKFCAVDGVLFTKEMQQLVCYPAGRKAKKYTIPDGVSEIGYAAFFSCRGLSEVIIPMGVTMVGDRAFQYCEALSEVYWLAGAGCKVRGSAFWNIARPATLYVRQGEKRAIQDAMGSQHFSAVVEGYVVTLKDSDGKRLGEQLVKPNGQATEPAVPIKKGYTSVEWQRNGTKYDFSEEVTEDITLEAVWKKVEYTVSFDAKGGTPTPGAQTVAPNGTADEPQAPTLTGFIFKGWYLDGVKYVFTTPVTRSITLVAQWEADPSAPQPSAYTVSFNANGGTPTPNTQQVEPNGTVDEPKAPTLTGFIFKGWYLDGVKYVFTTPVTRSITLVAEWEAESTAPQPSTYTVSFDAKGGAPTPNTQQVKPNGTADEPQVPTLTGFIFKGWYLDGVKYVFTTPVTRSITLVAEWEENSSSPQPSTYTVSFNAKGGTPTPNTQQVEPNGTVDEPKAPTLTGFIFKGWYLDGVKYVFTTPVTQSITLEAQWEAESTAPQPSAYTVSFNANGGTPTPNTQQVEPNGTVDEPKAPTLTGFIFKGWYLDGVKYVFTTPVTRSITLVAEWEAESTAPQPSTYTVSFDAKGGAPTPNTQQVKPNGTADEPQVPTLTGFIFKGWYLDGVKYVFTTPVTRSITLEAQWEAGENKPNNTETAVESVELAGVRVVQNPVGEVLELEGMERAVRVEVYSAGGVRLYAESLHGAERVAIDARGWASGVYVVRVVASDGAKTLRVMK